MAGPAPESGEQAKDAKPAREIVQEAVDNLLDKSKNHGGITLGHIWTILRDGVPAATTWKVLGGLVTAALFIAWVGWEAHAIKVQLLPATARPVQPIRAPMPNVLDAETSFVSDQAPDWLYPLVQKLEGNSRTALQVRVPFQHAAQGARVQLISSAPQPPTGFAFVVRKDGERECYEPLPRLKDENLQFIVDVPPSDSGDELIFLTSLASGVTGEQLRGLFTVRRADK